MTRPKKPLAIVTATLVLGLILLGIAAWLFNSPPSASMRVHTPDQGINNAVTQQKLRSITVQYSPSPAATRYLLAASDGRRAVTQYIVQDEVSLNTTVLLVVAPSPDWRRQTLEDLLTMQSHQEGDWALEDGALVHRPVKKGDTSHGTTAVYPRYEDGQFIPVQTMGFQLYFEGEDQIFYAISDGFLSKQDFTALLSQLEQQRWLNAI